MISEKLKVPLNNISIYLVANHAFTEYVLNTGKTAGIPFFMKIMVGDRDATDELRPEQLMMEAYHRVLRLSPLMAPYEGTAVVASSAMDIMLAISRRISPVSMRLPCRAGK